MGARGAISTCVAYGLAGLEKGTLESTGLLTAFPPFDELDLLPWEGFVLGGHDVCRRDISQSAGELVQSGILPADLVTESSSAAAAFSARIQPGLLDGPEVGLADLDPRTAELSAAEPRKQIEQLISDWESFEEETGCVRTVVVYVASAEVQRSVQEEWSDLATFEAALDEGREQPASVLYAYAALKSGRAFVNFTPNVGASIPALRQLAEQTGVPHCGSDGKTGETLVKTVLGPMFRARGLRVLSWQGYNMLGNRDGEVLREETHRQTKVGNKDRALRSILGEDPRMHTHVGIDYVPSLGDWKTAMDYVHFEGFLGARMSLQFTWTGSDSALAAPLVLDLARLTELSMQRGESGVMEHTASFFKDPMAGGTHDFHQQLQSLLAYVERTASRRRS